jgi:hypothetical protein
VTNPTTPPAPREDSDAYFELTSMANSVRGDHQRVMHEWGLTFGQVRAYVKELDTLRADLATARGELDAERAAHEKIATQCFAVGAESSDGTSISAVIDLAMRYKALTIGLAARTSDAQAVTDTQIVEWLRTMNVEVRKPARWGSRYVFASRPEDDEVVGLVPSDLREKCKAALAARGGA